MYPLPFSFRSQNDEVEVIQPPQGASSDQSDGDDDLREYLEKTDPTKAPISVPQPTSPKDIIQEGMSRFETSGERSPALKKLYLALQSVPPTSCEAERCDYIF